MRKEVSLMDDINAMMKYVSFRLQKSMNIYVYEWIKRVFT